MESNKNPAKFPEELQKKFEDKKWTTLTPPTFLDYPGAEILIMSASDDLKDEFGKVGIQLEDDEKFEAEKILLPSDAVFKELHMNERNTSQTSPKRHLGVNSVHNVITT